MAVPLRSLRQECETGPPNSAPESRNACNTTTPCIEARPMSAAPDNSSASACASAAATSRCEQIFASEPKQTSAQRAEPLAAASASTDTTWFRSKNAATPASTHRSQSASIRPSRSARGGDVGSAHSTASEASTVHKSPSRSAKGGDVGSAHATASEAFSVPKPPLFRIYRATMSRRMWSMKDSSTSMSCVPVASPVANTPWQVCLSCAPKDASRTAGLSSGHRDDAASATRESVSIA
mmetsp:Transcript_76623/g.212928  ORF Transcript_76623/g.212928 Transcript_76623/m.212928 type:complete len:238 (+) Transcript_76623:956-1669(+)